MKTVEEYVKNGLDPRTAAYFASGRRQITSVRAEDDFTLQMTFDNGEVRVLDCKPFLKEGTVFEPFLALGNFKRVYLDSFHCVAWDVDPTIDSEVVWLNKVDLCPDACYMDSTPLALLHKG